MRQIAVIGNYLPRQCGIATFTTDLCESIAAEFPTTNCIAIPVNDKAERYAYPPPVRFELSQDDLSSYKRGADFLNINHCDVLSLQHEYGIYGGPHGSHILSLLEDIRIPVVTTLHTVLREPSSEQRTVLQKVAALSERLVVMSRQGARFLQDVYGVPAGKIDVIPHGIPDVPFVDPNFYKDKFGVEGKHTLLTFGLLSANKGLEGVIEALPAILQRHPNVVYMIVGATHPSVRQHEGERYRQSLVQRAQELGVEQNVIFFDRFVDIKELIEFIGVADIYLTPYLNPEQISSGTLAYALGMGKATISTSYWYAKDLLAANRGILVPFRSPEAIAEEVIGLLDNDIERHAMRKRAYMYGRKMIWPIVAREYMKSFERAQERQRSHPHPVSVAAKPSRYMREFPEVNLHHLERMTDGTGILQHACYSVPSYEHGYTTDDNARALIVGMRLEEWNGKEKRTKIDTLVSRYLAFLSHAFNKEEGRFRNFMAYDRAWLEDVGSEDSHGRAIWGLGTVVGYSTHCNLRNLAAQILEEALPATLAFTSPRAWAYTLIGLDEYFKRFEGDTTAYTIREELGRRLMECFRNTSAPDWVWFEDSLSYGNARLSQACLLCGTGKGDKEMVEAGLKSLRWLAAIQQAPEGHFVPIGSNGFYERGKEPARFDQQPIEAYTMISACLDAYRLTGDASWHLEARRAFDWFLGQNDLGSPLYDSTTGGCRDGLHPDRLNQNQGAESTISFLLSLLEMRIADRIFRNGGRIEMTQEPYRQASQIGMNGSGISLIK